MTTLFISHSSKDKAWAEQVHGALKTAGYRGVFLDSHPDDGIHAGAEWEQTLYQRLRQSRGVVVLCSAHWLASPWCVAEAMMARERKRRVFLLATADIADGRQVKRPDGTDVPHIPEFLKDRQFISLSGMSDDEALQQLLHGLETEGLDKRNFERPDRPYPGLEPFTDKDGAIFFGRDEEIDQVTDVLHRRRKGDASGFILLLGASGCGKSSLVRAGVLPQLKSASKDDRGPWVIVPPFTGGQGLEGLAESLERAFRDAGEPRELDDIRQGRAHADTLRSLCSKLRVAHGASEGLVLIVLDQLEEVFGTPEGSNARRALRLLLDVSEETFSPVVTVATMRSDFLNAFQLFEGAARRYEEITLDPMLRSHFSEVIEGPAACFGLDLDTGLAERMKEDAAYADALPLLAFTLKRLYDEYRGNGKLELAEYEKLFPPVAVHGSTTKVRGVAAAIKITADEILEHSGYTQNGKPLPDDDPRMRDLRRAFYRLAQVGEEGQFTRRIARRAQMPVSCDAVLKRFVERRLLVSGADDHNNPTLTVAHEALFRVWDTLNGWLREDRKALALRAQIEDAAAEWQAEDRAESRAWPEERILDAVRQIEESGVSLADVKDRATVDAFLGPTDSRQLEELPALDAADDATKGSGRYGEAWRLPLGHPARSSAGVRLALLGDPRPGVGLRADGLPHIAWVDVEGGAVTIEVREDVRYANSPVVDRLSRAVGSFRMARYPVTLAQFQAFLEECHRNGQWLLPAGFPVELPADYSPPKPRSRFANHPVDSVNWFDASAFCHWLGVRLDTNVRLPTEFEWQLAATGGDPERTYPWGPDWNPAEEPWRANTIESELNRSTAVGMYPAGAAPAGILDMAGTIYEWCLNTFDDPDNIGFSMDTKLRRVLRGGSWFSFRNVARSADRYRVSPNDRINLIGFRVVCSSPSADTEH